MPDQKSHPSREELAAYSLGQLPQDESVAIDSHISECESCCDTMVGLSSDDTFVALLKEAKKLPTDQTVDHEHSSVTASASFVSVPDELSQHPRYEVLGLIGKGGMGDVFKAKHRRMERTVALKVINRNFVRKPEAVDRFHREVKTAAQLTHPNIVTAFDADESGEFHFMVMEYVDGIDLSRCVKDHGALSVVDACRYISQAAQGLQHAHECGMVHRDIKPHNLMVTTDGTVKILDFGLASLAPSLIADSDEIESRSDLTVAGSLMGTPDFVSPEQARDARQADIRSDIYSLGATLYFLLSGRPPFDEGSALDKLKSHAESEPESLLTIRDDTPNSLMTIVSRMMAKDAQQRFQTPAAVSEALETYLQDEPIRSNVPEVRSNQRVVGLGLALVISALVLGIVFFQSEAVLNYLRREAIGDFQANTSPTESDSEDRSAERERSPSRTELLQAQVEENRARLETLQKEHNELLGKLQREEDPIRRASIDADVAASSETIQQLVAEIRRIEDERAKASIEEYRSRRRAALEEELTKSGITFSKEGIQEYLRAITRIDGDKSAAELIVQLGADRFSDREAAERALMLLPRPPVELLREASQGSNPEVSYRAKRVLENAVTRQERSVDAAFRAIEMEQYIGLTSEIIAVVATFSDSPRIVESAKRLLPSVVTNADVMFLSSQMTTDVLPSVRQVAIRALRRLQDQTVADSFEDWSRANAFTEETRLEAALALADLGDRRSMGLLLSLMVDAESASVRARGQVGLQRLTGQRFEYYAYAKQGDRSSAAVEWQEWIDGDGRVAALFYPLEATNAQSFGHTIVALRESRKEQGGVVIEYDEQMNEIWRYDCSFPGSVEVMENGNLLITEDGKDRVIEVTREKVIVRQHRFTDPYSARALANGNFLVADKYEGGAGLFEINPAGEIVWEHSPQGQWLNHPTRLDNGNTIAASQWNVGKNGVIEIDPSGNVVWEWKEIHGSIEEVQVLENGNVLVTGLSGDIIEIDKEMGQIVWQITREDVRNAYRLNGGNMLILTESRISEEDTEGEELWSQPIETVSGTIRRVDSLARQALPRDFDSLTLVAMSGQGKVKLFDEEMNEVWSYDCDYPKNAEKMDNGNILINVRYRVIEVNLEKEIVRRHDVPDLESARPLSNGNFLVSSEDQEKAAILEIDPDGEIDWELKIEGRDFADAVRLENGNTLVIGTITEPWEGFVAEYDPQGKAVWEIQGFNSTYSTVDSLNVLDNGNVMLTFLQDFAIEIDKQTGETVWQKEAEGVRDAFRLENGNTLMIAGKGYCQLLEVDPQGNVIRSRELGQDHHGSVRR